MNKRVIRPQATAPSGIDVSARSLAVARIEFDGSLVQRELANNVSEHKSILAWLAKCNAKVGVSLAATGIYSMNLALA